MVLVAHGFRAHGLHVMKAFKRLVILHCNVSRVECEGSLGRGQEVGSAWLGLVKGNNRSIVGWFLRFTSPCITIQENFHNIKNVVTHILYKCSYKSLCLTLRHFNLYIIFLPFYTRHTSIYKLLHLDYISIKSTLYISLILIANMGSHLK
jgi:hypothetical protein